MTREIIRVDPLSVGKVVGILYFVLGLIFGLLFVALPGFMPMGGPRGDLPIGLLFALPILYGILGFVSSFIFAGLYNVVAARIGGIRLDFADSQTGT